MAGEPLKKGNSKLGKNVFKTSIQAGVSCPGKTEFCASKCYAQKGTFTFPAVKGYLEARYNDAKDNPNHYFAALFDQLAKKQPSVVRVHESGDFFSTEYIERFYELARAFPNVHFYAYTRSWRVPGLTASLEKLGSLTNFQLNTSEDPETGPSPNVGGIRTTIVPKGKGVPSGFIACPEQLGKLDTCTDCGLCFKQTKVNIAFLEH